MVEPTAKHEYLSIEKHTARQGYEPDDPLHNPEIPAATGEDHINRCPNVVLVRIWAFLNLQDLPNKIALVCSRWNTVQSFAYKEYPELALEINITERQLVKRQIDDTPFYFKSNQLLLPSGRVVVKNNDMPGDGRCRLRITMDQRSPSATIGKLQSLFPHITKLVIVQVNGHIRETARSGQ